MVSPRNLQQLSFQQHRYAPWGLGHLKPEEEARKQRQISEKANETARIITGNPRATGEVRDPDRFLRHLEGEQDIHQVFKTFQGSVDQIRNDPALSQVVADEQRLRLERGLPASVHLESADNFLRGYDEWEKKLPSRRRRVEPCI